MPYALCFLLFIIGLYCAVVKKNMVKIVIGIMVMEYAVNLFLIMLGYRTDGIAPIIDKAQFDPETRQIAASFVNSSVDPLPQALVLTAIVIGFGLTVFALTLLNRARKASGTDDVDAFNRTDAV